MPRARLKGAQAQATPATPSLPIEGIVVRKEHLVALLRGHLPQLTDLQAFEDGERFFLVLAQEPRGGEEKGGSP